MLLIGLCAYGVQLTGMFYTAYERGCVEENEDRSRMRFALNITVQEYRALNTAV